MTALYELIIPTLFSLILGSAVFLLVYWGYTRDMARRPVHHAIEMQQCPNCGTVHGTLVVP